MRVGIIAAAGVRASAEPLLGERDASLVKARLELADLGYQVSVVDPTVDMAQQLDDYLAHLPVPPEEVLLYASCLLAVVDDGECFLCLDPSQPDVGDAVRDVATVLVGRTGGSALLIADLRFDERDADQQTLHAVLEALQANVAEEAPALEIIAAVRPVQAHAERIPSRLTAGLLEVVDDSHGALAAKQAYASAIQRIELGCWPNAVCYRPGATPAMLRAGEPLPSPADAPPTPAPAQPTPEPAPAVPPPEPGPAVPTPEPGPAAPPPEPAPAAPPPEPAPADPEPAPADPEPAPVVPAPPPTPPEAKAVPLERRPAPPSERRESATAQLPSRRAPSTAPSEKVVIGGNRKRPSPASDPLVKTHAEVPDAKRAASASDAAASSMPAPDEPPDEILDELSVDEDLPDVAPGRSAPPSPSAPPPPLLRRRMADMTVEDHIEAGDLARALDHHDEAISHFKKGLAKLGTTASPERAHIYLRIGDMMRKTGNSRLAISNYDKALSIVPDDLHVLASLVALNAEDGNWRAVRAAEEKFFAGVQDGDTKLAALMASGDRWRELAGQLAVATERYRQARVLFPDRAEPLRGLLAVHEANDNVRESVETRRLIAEVLREPSEKAAAYFELGRYCLGVAREQEAFQAFEQVLDADPTMLQALEILAGALAEHQEWAELERVYRKMIDHFVAREDDEATRTVLAELYRRSALLCRDHLHDPDSALAALEREIALGPEQLSARLLAAELAGEVAAPRRALEHLRGAALIEPRRAETYHQIFAVGEDADAPEVAFLAANVTQALEVATDREVQVFREYRVEGVPPLDHPLPDETWELLRYADRDPLVDDVMRALAPAVVRLRVKQLEAEGKLPDFPDSMRQDPATSTISAVRSVAWGCQYLGIALPEIYVYEDHEGGFTAPFGHGRITIVGREALRGRTLGELAFMVGRHLTCRRPEHELVAHLRSADELTLCFLAGLQLALGEVPVRGATAKAVEAFAELLGGQQPPAEQDRLFEAVQRFDEAGGRVNLLRWGRAVEICAARAGLLLCGDLPTALAVLRREGDTPLATVDERIDDLCAWAVSSAHARLRIELGSTLQSDEDAEILDAV